MEQATSNEVRHNVIGNKRYFGSDSGEFNNPIEHER